MSKVILVIISIATILGVGGLGMLLSIEQTNTQPVDTVIVSKVIDTPQKASEVLTENHNSTIALVDIMIKIYDDGNQELSAIDQKLGYKIQGVGERYGFIWDAENVEILAHPSPDLVGRNLFDIISPNESKQEILTTLETDGQIWIHYDFINPENKQTEPKTTLLKLHDGLIFGSGFYN